jgi:hypothetical protein
VNRVLKGFGVLAAVIAIVVVALSFDRMADWFGNRTGGQFGSAQAMNPQLKCLEGEPHVMLWAWEYASDLRSINPHKVGVAYLAGKFILRSDSVIVKPRIQKLTVPDGTFMSAVMRIEPDHANGGPSFSDAQLKDLTINIVSLLSKRKVQLLQIDFDARQSERPFYLKVLTELRKQLPYDMPLSITALASWCLGDNWLDDASCDQVVPMFFSMGKDRQRMLNYLQNHPDFASVPMQVSMGLSIDEPDVLAQLNGLTSTTFLFSSKGWESERAKEWINKIQSGGSSWKDLAKLN